MIRHWLTSALTLSMTCYIALVAAPAVAQSGLDWLTASTQPRCGTPDRAARELLFGFPFDPSDCSATETNPTEEYDPGETYEIPVVVHILMDDSCTQGVISNDLVHSQIEILNEDLLALPGTNGENGTDAQIQFVLASEDPDGNPTDGITRDCNTTWYNDGGSYWNELAWDPHNYLNIYTNTAQGFLGYVPFLPADGGGGQVGQPHDRVVILWEAFGRDAPIGPPYDQGRTATHEVGHYLGLEHTFTPQGQCGTADPPACYSDGDLICDTEVEQSPRFGCPGGAQSCGSLDPIDNYMDYSDDLCMERFTLEQMRRNRCTLQFYRPDLYNVVESGSVSVTVVAQEGEAPPGETDTVGSLGSPFVNGLGQVGFTGGLDTADGTDSFVWFDDGITWKNSDADTNVLSGAEGTMGISDAGGFIYSPQTDGNDSVWTASGLLAVEGAAAPGFPAGVISVFHSRPTMLPSGRAHWVAGFNDTDGSGTDGRVLYTSADGTPGQIEVVLRSDDVIDGFTIDRPSGIDFDYDFSDNGAHHIHMLLMDTGSSANDGFVYVDGSLVARESEPTGDGDNWVNFDLMSINDGGDYVYSGDTDGDTASDELIAHNGSIVLREGGSVGDVELTSGASVNGLSINNHGALAHLWSIAGGTELLFLSCDAANPADGTLLLATGDEVDVDDDGVVDAVVTDFNASTVVGPGLELGTSGPLFVEVDLDYGDGDLEAIIALDLPACGGGAPLLAFDPASLELGDVDVDTTSPPQTATLHNTGDADATGIAFSGLPDGGFEADTSACGDTLPAGGSCVVSVTFTPPAPGPATATLHVASAEGAMADLGLSGNGTELEGPVADVSPAAFAFQVPQGGSDSDMLSIGNLGDADLTWSLAEAETAFVAPGMPYTYDLGWTPELHAPVGGDRASAGRVGRRPEPVDDAGARRPAHSPAASFRAGAGLNGPASRPADPMVLPAPQPAAVGSFTEGFDDITQLPGAGWAMINNSEPAGPSSWFQGNDSIFTAHEGAPDAYIAANFESTDDVGDISNWLLTPEVTIVNGTTVCFWTRTTEQFEEFFDRLEVRMSIAGDSTDVGDTAESVGVFTDLLLSINPDLLPGEYPEEWTELCVTVRERSREPVTGRFAFRYWVTDSGPNGTNGDYIGIDTVSVTQPDEVPPGGCDNPADIPWLAADPTSGTTTPGGSEPVNVSVDTAGLEVGEHTAQLCVTTNDPNAALVEVPVSLTVTDGGPAEFEITTLLLEGGEVPDVGLVTTINNLAVNGAGSWIVEADTDNADTDFDSVLVRDGTLHLREGDPVTEPAGASIDSFDTVNLDDSGNSGWNFFLAGTTGGGDDSGVYFNTDLLIQEGDVSTAPELSPDTPYVGFFEAKIAGPSSILLMASVDDPAISSTVDRALVVLTLDGGGGLESEHVIAKEGDVLPGQTEAVEDFETGPHNFDYNSAGAAMYAADLTGDTASDIAIYIDDAIVAQEGGPSPVAGRNWASLTSPELSLANDGGYAFSGSLDGDAASNLLLVKNGDKLVQEGDTLPAIEPFLLTGFGTGPVLINDAGQVLWFGDWDDPDTGRDQGLFLDDRLLVQEGVTTIDGLIVESLSGVQDGYAMSDDGRHILFEATLAGGLNGVFLLSFEEPR